MFNKKKLLFFTAFIVVFVFFMSKYYSYKKYIRIYNDQVIELVRLIENYRIARQENTPTNKEDFIMMMKYLSSYDTIKELLDYGLNFEYDENSKRLILYSFGVDGEDNKLSHKFIPNNRDPIGSTIMGENDFINNYSLRDIFSNSKDVVIFDVLINDKDYLCIKYKNNNEIPIGISRTYRFFLGDNFVMTPEDSKPLKKELNSILKEYYQNVSYDDTEGLNLFFLKYKQGKLSYKCNKLNLSLGEKIENEIIKMLKTHKISYAVIPIQ